jgi:hypothetical protein
MADLWQLSGQLFGRTVHARWDEGGLAADPDLYEACLDLVDAGKLVDMTPTGPFCQASIASPDAAWATVRAALDDVTEAVGEAPGWPWGVPADATDT